MQDLQLQEAVERYIRGEMDPGERAHFEQLRTSNAEVDQLVVEHTLFLQQMDRFGEWKNFKHTLNEVHADLAEQGQIDTARSGGKTKVVYLWNRYKRVAGIAASIAGVTAIAFSSLVNKLTPPPSDAKTKTELVSYIDDQVQGIKDDIKTKIDSVGNNQSSDINWNARFNGTGFLIDPKGLMITNAHVVKNSRNIYVQNSKGNRYKAIVVKLDVLKDVAIIKIDDHQFKGFPSLPYGIRKGNSELAEPVFTLGFPRQDEIVYGEGYLSARTGFNGDTLSCQIDVAANPGNSGGPVFNHNGEVIGILSAKQNKTVGAVFAVQSKYIYTALDELKKNNNLYQSVKVPSRSSLAGLDKVQQVKKIQDCVFIVKGD